MPNRTNRNRCINFTDISATSEDVVHTCCDLKKVNEQDLEFRMQLNLKNYDGSACRLYHEESTSTDDTIIVQDCMLTFITFVELNY